MNESRRTFLIRAMALVGASSVASNLSAAVQDNWRFCFKCNALFFDGFPAKGRCPRGGGHSRRHSGVVHNFRLPHSLPETRTAQAHWRFCQKCFAMFYDGFQPKGVCAAGGGHSPAGFDFALPHDTRLPGPSQTGWRFCNKCFVMFFTGAASGPCAAGGVHFAQGFQFVLRFVGNLENDNEGRPG